MTEPKERDIAVFKKAMSDMVAKSGKLWKESLGQWHPRIKEYSKEEVKKIINGNNLNEQLKLSRSFYYKDGFYKRILIYYATLLKYVGILIPNPSLGTQLSTPYVAKRYNNALNYLDKFELPTLLAQISLKVLIDGCYYGILKEVSRTDFVLLDLPAEYCRSNFKDLHGNDVIEFNVNYFTSIIDSKVKKQALRVYPKVITSHYEKYSNGVVKSPWVKIPTDLGFCFPFFDDGRPLFLDVIPATIDYDEAVEVNKERDLEEIRKVLIQKIPHLQDGTLLFEPDEALEMHIGAVDMMRGNRNISVLTTYADVDAVVSKAGSEATTNSLEKSLQNIYSKASVSSQLFSATGSQALSTSITNDLSLMMTLANKYSHFLTYIINSLFANSNIDFKFLILPVSWYNASEYISDTLKLAQSGYSFLLPAIASGVSQKDLVNLKELENTALNLPQKLIPLESSYNQSSGEVGRPRLSVDEKAPKTLQNEESLDKQ